MSLQSILESAIPLFQTSDWNAATRSVDLIQQALADEHGDFSHTNDVGDTPVAEPSKLVDLLSGSSSSPWIKSITETRNDLVWHGSARATSAAYCQIIGPKCPYSSSQLRFGIFFIPREYAYRAHVHGADEIYIPIAGRGEWAMDDEEFSQRPDNVVVPIESMRPHAIRTSADPVLTFYTWTGDISFDRYRFC